MAISIAMTVPTNFLGQAEAVALLASFQKQHQASIPTAEKRNCNALDHENDYLDSKRVRMSLSPIERSCPGDDLLASNPKGDPAINNTSLSLRRVSRSNIRNWRQIFCDTLNISSHIPDDDLEYLLEDRLLPFTPAQNVSSPQPAEPSYRFLHRTACQNSLHRRLWVDEPFLAGIDGSRHLSGKDEVSDYLEQIHKHKLTFLIIKEYNCCGNAAAFDKEDRLVPYGETLILNSAQLCKALNHVQKRVIDRINSVRTFDIHVERPDLQYWLYCFQDDVIQLAESNNDKEVPYQVCILKSQQGYELSRGVRLSSWPEFESSFIPLDKDIADAGNSRNVTTKMNSPQFHWEFNGHFYHSVNPNVTHKFDWISDEPLEIVNLPLVPYKYLDNTVQFMLQQRGQMIWSCRYQKFVSYSGYDSPELERFIDSRFMIDCNSFRYMQPPPKTSSQTPNAGVIDNFGPTEMKKEEPPAGDFVLLLPATLMGFNMQDKRWKSLVMCRVREVDWDNEAFHCLVLPQDTKDVNKALVTHRVAHSKSSDLIQSKGRGLTLLFHGPPGTGKTLTAESVAEHARKPLYRVTCGDIGTQPEAVEQYMKQVLNRAKVWDCVVLLDEAEVFLQERSLTDLHRNALVSVFLRVLEYYDGILILTSNRVGTLDEGFRSRIQLALEYSKLDRGSRRKIWETFVERLNDDPTISGELDITNLRSNLAELSKYELNGREIRNAINVAKPVALSCGDKVDFQCLKKVIGVQSRFDRYIRDMNEGLDDDKVAREEGKR
ncbi:putative 26S proteasome regulatory subunit-like protein [Colletotrichum fructicola]|nr:putative 26S proteasome regulatory subunit-like protein [Colletotrichum fructicola]KAF4916592.1 putative 26S proteasome regulatory subunit-like protein [Colletotrichum fructicola]KAF4932719.1 putative 26S proteasome regulatory subunit-like protein [Colletotrichum fructicola]